MSALLGPDDVRVGDHITSRHIEGGDTYIVDRLYPVVRGADDTRQVRCVNTRTGSQHMKNTRDIRHVTDPEDTGGGDTA